MSDATAGPDEDPSVSCSFQNGTLAVYDTHVEISRAARSNYEDKRIEMSEIVGASYTPGIMTGNLQIEQRGIEPAEGGVFTHPVDENTLYFPRSKRDCAKRARDAILERMGGE